MRPAAVRPGAFDGGGEDLPVHGFLRKRRQKQNRGHGNSAWARYADDCGGTGFCGARV